MFTYPLTNCLYYIPDRYLDIDPTPTYIPEEKPIYPETNTFVFVPKNPYYRITTVHRR